MNKIAVIGGGAWGCALASAILKKGYYPFILTSSTKRAEISRSRREVGEMDASFGNEIISLSSKVIILNFPPVTWSLEVV